jgi:hypothetical protein
LKANAWYASVQTSQSSDQGRIRCDEVIVFQPLVAGRTITGRYRRIEV